MVASHWFAAALSWFLCSFSFGPAAADAPRQYLLASDLARPVVRILADDYAATQAYRNGTGVLVGRCDVLLTARHVALSGGLFRPERLQVYSPQIRGKVVEVVDAPDARALWPQGDRLENSDNLDGDLVVLKLSSCPTHSYVALGQVRPIVFADLKQLKSIGFACDSGHKRGPEELTLRGTFQQVAPSLGVSRSILLTPGARPGQSGSPIYAIRAGKLPALTMIMSATVRDVEAPVGCGRDRETGASKAGSASYGAVLTRGFIEALSAYVRGLE